MFEERRTFRGWSTQSFRDPGCGRQHAASTVTSACLTSDQEAEKECGGSHRDLWGPDLGGASTTLATSHWPKLSHELYSAAKEAGKCSLPRRRVEKGVGANTVSAPNETSNIVSRCTYVVIKCLKVRE